MSELNFKSIKDVLSFAIAEEQDSHLYYKCQAKKAPKIELKVIWEQLANDEVRHAAILSELLEKVELGDESSFTKKDMPDFVDVHIPEGNYSEMDLIIIDAIKKENEAYFMYKNLATKMIEEKHKDVLITLALEELKHKDDLHRELNL